MLAGAAHGAAVPRESSPASLVMARLVKVEDITGTPGAPCFCDENGVVMLDGSFRLTFRVVGTITGPAAHGHFSVDQASAMPRRGGSYFLVIVGTRGKRAIAWRGNTQYGLCLEPDEVARYSLEKAVKRYPCRS